MGAHLKALNRKQQQRRIALGRTGDIKDPSIMSLEEAKSYRLELKEALRAEGRDIDDLNLDAFADLTDRENPDFFYVSLLQDICRCCKLKIDHTGHLMHRAPGHLGWRLSVMIACVVRFDTGSSL